MTTTVLRLTRSARFELISHFLQRVCLAGASNKALGRPLKTSLKGNERRWFARGYKAGGPGACNTRTVPSSKIS